MKSEEEIERAHNLIAALLLGEVDLDLSEDSLALLRSFMSVLCWTLNHPTDSFENLLNRLEEQVRSKGYEVRRESIH